MLTMREIVGVTISILLLAITAAGSTGCRFNYDPVSAPQYYREEGWTLPGTKDFNPSAQPNLGLVPRVYHIPDVVNELLTHNEYSYVVEFPAQLFTLGGIPERMRQLVAKAAIVRFKVRGRVIAYSYGLAPISARHKADGLRVVEGEGGCMFEATFIDDKGDGVFRILVPGPLTNELVPAWAKKPES
jgi:hypothetical protein